MTPLRFVTQYLTVTVVFPITRVLGQSVSSNRRDVLKFYGKTFS